MRWSSNVTGGGLVVGVVLFGASVQAQEQERAPHRESARFEVDAALGRCVEILLERQENLSASEGAGATHEGEPREWPYEGVHRVLRDGRRVIPLGYRIGGTAIAMWSLLEAPRWGDDEARQAAVQRGLDFVLTELHDPTMSPEFQRGYDVRGWGHIYALQCLLRMRELERVPDAVSDAVDQEVTRLVGVLQTSEIANGAGWNYSRRGAPASPSTFMSAPALLALYFARKQGEAVDSELVERGLDSLDEARLGSGAYQYVTNARKSGQGFEAVQGAVGRMPVCEAALLLGGRGDIGRLEASIDAFFEHWEWLEKRRRQNGTHVEPYMIAPYYFFFAHYYTALAIELLPEERRAPHRQRLYAKLAEVREESGGWNDRVFDRSEAFGTSMTLLALCQPDLPRPASWKAQRRRD